MSYRMKVAGFKKSLKLGVAWFVQHLLTGPNAHAVAGIKIMCSGRWSKTKSGRSQQFNYCLGKVGAQSFSTLLDFGFAVATTKYGTCGVKVWVAHKRIHLN